MRVGRAMMKDTLEPTSLRASADEENFANRKLIRPALPRPDQNHGNHNANHAPSSERRERPDRAERSFDRGDRPSGGGGGRKTAPLEQTNAENFYYQKQMQSRTPMVIVLRDGEEVHGIIEWYDKGCIKVNRDDGRPNLMIYKPAIKYMFKAEER
ncbi:MAG: Hfq-like protein [Candidatus Sulfotelmatobacter sp.]